VYVARAIPPAEMIENLTFPAEYKIALSRDAQARWPAPQVKSWGGSACHDNAKLIAQYRRVLLFTC